MTHTDRRRKPRWKKVCEPAGAVLATMGRIGWKAVTWDRWVDRRGTVLDLTAVCPRTIDHLVENATESALHWQVAEAMGRPEFEDGLFLESIAKFIGQPSRAKLPRSADKTWSAKAAAHLRSTVVGAQ